MSTNMTGALLATETGTGHTAPAASLGNDGDPVVARPEARRKAPSVEAARCSDGECQPLTAKELFDCYALLAQRETSERDKRRESEWKITLALWSGFAAATLLPITGRLSGGGHLRSWVADIAIAVMVGAAGAGCWIHEVWVRGIEKANSYNSRRQYVWEAKMAALVGEAGRPSVGEERPDSEKRYAGDCQRNTSRLLATVAVLSASGFWLFPAASNSPPPTLAVTVKSEGDRIAALTKHVARLDARLQKVQKRDSTSSQPSE